MFIAMLQDLLTNIFAGTRLALLRKVDRDEFVVSTSQFVILLVIGLGLLGVLEHSSGWVDPSAAPVSWSSTVTRFLAGLIGAFVVAAIQRSVASFSGFIIVLEAAMPVLTLVMMLLFLSMVLLGQPVGDAANEAEMAQSDMGFLLLLPLLGLLLAGGWAFVSLLGVCCVSFGSARDALCCC